ncbi:hypothetical protein A9K56_02085 [Stenotrophomonas maltophilia]|uniref:Uncharacterized protein n=1 Tax=Stenotrophomonas maltophilia TaxID=40324 RepID=A0AAP7GVA0_STEMA|nr:hypothetical protein A9K56_02085 [Stenotrophomonas maltophilia]
MQQQPRAADHQLWSVQRLPRHLQRSGQRRQAHPHLRPAQAPEELGQAQRPDQQYDGNQGVSGQIRSAQQPGGGEQYRQMGTRLQP